MKSSEQQSISIILTAILLFAILSFIFNAENEQRRKLSSSQIWETMTDNQKSYDIVPIVPFDTLNPTDHELVRSYLYFGVQKGHGYEQMIQKFDSEHPGHKFYSLRKCMINEWQIKNYSNLKD